MKTSAEINAREPERLTPEEAERMDDGASVSLEDLKSELEEYSGRLVLRIPRSLHKSLKEAAAMEGVSRNQYCVYLLSRNDAMRHRPGVEALCSSFIPGSRRSANGPMCRTNTRRSAWAARQTIWLKTVYQHTMAVAQKVDAFFRDIAAPEQAGAFRV